MKNQMELNRLGLVELNQKEMVAIEGGSFWGWVAVIAAAVAVVAAIIAGATHDK